MPSSAGQMVTTWVAGDTTFSPESPEYHDSFWQGIADGVGDQNSPPIRLSSPGLARAMRPRHRDALPCPAAVRILASGQVLDRRKDCLVRSPEADSRQQWRVASAEIPAAAHGRGDHRDTRGHPR